MPHSPGAELALLLLGGFHAMVDEVVAGLAEQGHPDVTAGHEFALRAVDQGAGSASELGRALAVSKQAAAKTISALEDRGYLTREPDPEDARRKRLRVTDRGHDMMARGAALFDDVRARWAGEVGEEAADAVETLLAVLAGGTGPSSPASLVASDGEPLVDRGARRRR